MASHRGIRQTLVWSVIALYGAIMIPAEGLHAFSASGDARVERGAADSYPNCRPAPLLAAGHDEGSCVICSCLSQIQTPDPGSALRTPPRQVRLDHAPVVLAVELTPIASGDPRAPPQNMPI